MSKMLEDIIFSVESARKEIYGEYNEEEQKVINEWKLKLINPDVLKFTVFADVEFLRNFIKIIPLSDQFLYVENTCNYILDKECNHKYVIVTRRSIYSETPKPEVFWSTEHRIVLNGLKNEMPEKSPVRLHSSIMVSTLGRLEKHGLSFTNAGSSDGEIVIDPYKCFYDFLFIYKPEREIKLLNEYLNSGGITQMELLEELKESAKERMEHQGLISDGGNTL